jgi:hypothetical protein
MSDDGSSTEDTSPPQDRPYRQLAHQRENTVGDRDRSVDRLCTIQNRAQRTLDQQVRWIRAIDKKSMRILRFNFVIIGLLLTGFSIATDFGTAGNVDGEQLQYTSQFVNVHTKYGSLSLLLSTVFAGLTYTASTMQLGIGSGLIEDIQDRDYHGPGYHENLVRYYSDWIDENNDKLSTNAFLITLTTWLAIYGVVVLALGITYPIFDFVPDNSFVLVTVFIAALALLSITDKL